MSTGPAGTMAASAGAALVMVGFDGESPPPELLEWVDQGLAGVIHFARNAADAGRLAQCSATLQQRAGGRGLLIAIDEEGGSVSRLPPGPARFPGAMALGAAGDPDLARRCGRATAGQLRAVGVNVDLAPVVDVQSNPANPVIGVRSFGGDPATVAVQGTAWLQGLQSGGVLAVAKHFPGHGDVRVDSHRELPVSPKTVAGLERVELVPFRAAIAAGVAGVMSAHIALPALDASRRPATRSAPVLTDLLRDRLGFPGLIMTDCMEMKGVRTDVPVPEAAVQAVEAGADLVLVSHTPAVQRAAIEALEQAVAQGRIPRARVEESLARIAAAKAAYRLNARALPDPDAAAALLDRPSDRALAREIAERALTVVRAGTLPAGSRFCVIACRRRDPTDPTRAAPNPLTAELTARGAAATLTLAVDPAAEDVREAAALAAAHETCVLALTRTRFAPGQRALLHAVAATGRPLYVWCLDPLDAPSAVAAGAQAVLVGYDDATATLAAAAAALCGEIAPTGRAPVAVPGL